MNKLLKQKNIIIIAVAVVIAIIAAVTVRLGARKSDVVTGSVNTLSRPLRTLMGAVVDELEDIYGYLYQYDKLKDENEQLRERINELEREYREYIEVDDENSRLRSLLGLSERNADYKYANATLVTWTSSSWGSAFSIDKGSSGGVKVGDPVITEMGYLVGRVTEVSASSAIVTTILDTSTSIGAEDSLTNELALVQGDFDAMKTNHMLLRYLPEQHQVKSGDTIVTSGGGGTYPQGLVIGTVDKVVRSSSGLGDYAVLTPAADVSSLEFLFVVTAYDAD